MGKGFLYYLMFIINLSLDDPLIYCGTLLPPDFQASIHCCWINKGVNVFCLRVFASASALAIVNISCALP